MPIQTAFNAGELSPQVYGRPDLAKYQNGCRTLNNMICLAHGPATSRGGTVFVSEVKDSTKKVRLVEYEFSVEQAYIHEYGNNYIRFYMDGWQIESAPSTPYEVTTTYLEAELPYMDFASSADVTFIASSTHAPATLSRNDHDDWTLADYTLTTGPFDARNATAITLTPSATTGTITITASAALWTADDVGRLVRIDHSGTEGIAAITGFTSTTVVDATVHATFGAATASALWDLGSWCVTNGYPKTVSFNNDRLWWAGSPLYPQRLWASTIGVYNDHSVSDPLADDDSLQLTLGAKKANAIQWLASGRKFSVGTTGAEYWIQSGTGDGAITPLSKDAPAGSFDGCSHVKPVMAASAMIFLMRHQRILKELKYTYSSDSFTGEEMSQIAEHLFRDYKITDMAFQREPYRIIWCVRDDGALLGLTYYPEHEVFGWHQHHIGGGGIVESIAVIPGDNEDQVWLSVKRTIGGSVKRYIERFSETFKGEDTTDAFYVDSGITGDSRQDIVSMTHVNPGVFTVTGHGYTDGDPITIRSIDDDVAGEESLLSLNNEKFTVYAKTTDTFQAKDDSGTVVDLSGYKQVISATVGKNFTVMTGLDHLEGEDVTILADGAPAGTKTVVSGQITLDVEASVVHVGYPFTSELETFPPDMMQQEGAESRIGSIKRITNVTAQLYKTLGMTIGSKSGWTYDYPFSSDDVPLGQPAPLYDGFTEDISFDDGPDREPTVTISQSHPLPLTVLAIHTTVEFED